MYYKIYRKYQVVDEDDVSVFSSSNWKEIFKNPVLICDDDDRICWVTDITNVCGNPVDEIEF